MIPVAKILKRHSYKNNKWKCVTLSGEASLWLKSYKQLSISAFIAASDTPQNIQTHDIETIEISPDVSLFYVVFKDPELNIQVGDYIYLSREQFPALTDGTVYLCDLMKEKIYSPDLARTFRIDKFFENGNARVSSVSVHLSEVSTQASEVPSIEVPLKALKQKDNHWIVEGLEAWENISLVEGASESESENESDDAE